MSHFPHRNPFPHSGHNQATQIPPVRLLICLALGLIGIGVMITTATYFLVGSSLRSPWDTVHAIALLVYGGAMLGYIYGRSTKIR